MIFASFQLDTAISVALLRYIDISAGRGVNLRNYSKPNSKMSLSVIQGYSRSICGCELVFLGSFAGGSNFFKGGTPKKTML
jgi:hypothetical protein